MANNSVESASYLDIPSDKLDQAQRIVDRVYEEIENEPEEYNPYGYCAVEFEFDKGGICFVNNDDGSFWAEHLARIAQPLLDELDIDQDFCFSWAYTCSKPRPDNFGGGACCVRRGKEPYYVDAMQDVLDYAKNNK